MAPFASSSSLSLSPPRSGPLLGSAYLLDASSIPPASPADIGTSICLNLSYFKSTIARYRKLDDAITTRLNRDAALHRADVLDVNEQSQRNTCQRIWVDVLESWRRREAVIRHCVATTDERVQDRVSDLQRVKARETAVDYDRLDADREARRVRDELYSEEARRQQLHNELSVESIVRRRTISAFFARCPDFVPPPNPDGSSSLPLVDLQPMLMPRRPINL